jgi:DNA-binding beta-propeller fold protein YncE
MKRDLPIILFCCLFISVSCSLLEQADDDTEHASDPFTGEGIFIVNEGNYMAGNGSLSFFSYDSARIFNNVFSEVNGRPLGDVPNYMTISGDYGYIVINNSGKIEVVNINTLKSVATIGNIISPRKILIVDNKKAYVSSLYSEEIIILDLVENKVSGHINIRRSSEDMLLVDKKAYISCWVSGKEILVINTLNDEIVDSVEVGNEPESMVLDKNKMLWVLCSGGYSGENFPELVSVNTSDDKMDKQITFPSKLLYPTSLQINTSGDTLFFIENGLWKMSISEPGLPDEPFIKPAGRMFYRLGVNPGSGDLYVTNVMDYQHRGYMLKINRRGSVADSVEADIIPGSICFKQNQE